MRAALVIVFVAFATSQKISDDDDEEGSPPIPKTSFTCDGKIDGFYADVETDCKVYHYCQTFVYPDDDSETKDWPFFCPPSTIFRQQHLTCSKPHKSFKCKDSEKFYDVNEKHEPDGDKPPGSPEEEPLTTTTVPTTSLETEPPLETTTEPPKEESTTTEKPGKPDKPDDGFLLPPLAPGEAEDQFVPLPPLLPYLLYPNIFPPWLQLHVKVPIDLKPYYAIFTPEEMKQFPLSKYLNKDPETQTLDDYLKKMSWKNFPNFLKNATFPASTTLLDPKAPVPHVLPKFGKKLFETSYTIKNGKLTNEPFKFIFFNQDTEFKGPR